MLWQPPLLAFETRSLPTLTRSYPRRFAFYVARPARSIQFSPSQRFSFSAFASTFLLSTFYLLLSSPLSVRKSLG